MDAKPGCCGMHHAGFYVSGVLYEYAQTMYGYKLVAENGINESGLQRRRCRNNAEVNGKVVRLVFVCTKRGQNRHAEVDGERVRF